MWPYIIMIIVASIVLLTTIVMTNNMKKSILLVLVLFFVGMESTSIMADLNAFFEQYTLAGNSMFYIFFNTMISSGLNEEFVKFAVLLMFTWLSGRLVTRYDAIVYSVAISIGMSTLETISYVLAEDERMLATAIIRIALCLTSHCSYAIVMGYFYGWAKILMSKKEYLKGFGSLTLALIVPMFLHTTYNTILEIAPYANVVFFVGMLLCLIGSVVACYTAKNNRPLRMAEEFDKKLMPFEYKLSPKNILSIISVLAIYSVLWAIYAYVVKIIIVTF